MDIKETVIKNHKKTIFSGKDEEIYDALMKFDKALKDQVKEGIESLARILKKKLGINISVNKANGQTIVEMNGWHKNKIFKINGRKSKKQ